MFRAILCAVSVSSEAWESLAGKEVVCMSLESKGESCVSWAACSVDRHSW